LRGWSPESCSVKHLVCHSMCHSMCRRACRPSNKDFDRRLQSAILERTYLRGQLAMLCFFFGMKCIPGGLAGRVFLSSEYFDCISDVTPEFLCGDRGY